MVGQAESNNGRFGVGEMPGLDLSLADILRRYQPPDLGVCWIAPAMGITLSWPNFDRWQEDLLGGTYNLTAGQVDTITIFTVPPIERAWLHYVLVEQNTGDNEVDHISYIPGGDYSNTQVLLRLIEQSTPTASLYWPDDANQGALDFSMNLPEPLLLEPGSRLQWTSTGAGVAASTYVSRILISRSRLVRVTAPSPS